MGKSNKFCVRTNGKVTMSQHCPGSQEGQHYPGVHQAQHGQLGKGGIVPLCSDLALPHPEFVSSFGCLNIKKVPSHQRVSKGGTQGGAGSGGEALWGEAEGTGSAQLEKGRLRGNPSAVTTAL